MPIAEIKFRRFEGVLGKSMDALQRTVNQLVRAVNDSSNTYRSWLGPWVESDLIGNSTLPTKLSAESSAGEWPDELGILNRCSIVGVSLGLNPAHATLDLKVEIKRTRGATTTTLWTGTLPSTETHKTFKIKPNTLKLQRDDLVYVNYVTPSGWIDNVNHLYVYLIIEG